MWRYLLALLLLIFAPPIHAVTVSILNSPSTVSSDPFEITAQVEGASIGTNYLRVDLYQDGTSNYFGDTNNGTEWYSGSDGKQYFPIEIIDDNPTIATLSARLGEPTFTEYLGPGNYKLRLRRYTASGSSGSGDLQSVDLGITYERPPSPTPTPTTTPTPSPSPTADSSLSSEAPTPSEAAGEVGQPSTTPSPKPSLTSSPEGTVAGLSIKSFHLPELASPHSETETPNKVLSSPKDEVGPSLNLDRARIALITGAGLIFLSLAGYLGYRQYYISHNS